MTMDAQDHRVYDFCLSPGDEPDLTVFCGIFCFKVHESILVAGSTFFAKAMEVELSEKASRVIRLTAQDPLIVQALICFLYTKAFDHGKGNIFDRDEPLIFIAKVYALAEEYGVEELKLLAKKKFEKSARKNYSDDSFSLAIRVIYTSTPMSDRGLRDLATMLSNEKYKELSLREAFNEAMNEVAAFGADMARKLAISGDELANALAECRKLETAAPFSRCTCNGCHKITMIDLSARESLNQHCTGCGSAYATRYWQLQKTTTSSLFGGFSGRPFG